MASAKLPPERAVVARVPMTLPSPAKATLFVGQPVDVLKRTGPSTRVRTRGPIRIEGEVPGRQIGICAARQAPARLTPEADPIGYVPRGWCFRTLPPDQPPWVRLADPGWGLTFLVEERFLAADIDTASRMDPILAGFVPYRIQPQPLRTSPKAAPHFTVPQGEWPMRSTHEEGGQAFIEILGATVVLQGWERTTNLYADLFRARDSVDLARQRLAAQRRPEADPRKWFRTTKKASLHARPGAGKIGEIDAGVPVLVNRRTGPWRQLRIEPKGPDGKALRALDTLLWIRGDGLEELRSAFD